MTYPRWARLDYGGVLVGLAFAAAAMTPSMLPRPAYYQGIVSGLSFGAGYLVGVLLWKIVRRAVSWRPRLLVEHGWAIILSVWTVAFALLVVVATGWQNGVREAVGLEPLAGYEGWLIVLVGAAVAALCIAIGRGIAALHQRVTERVLRRVHLGDARPSHTSAWIASAAVIALACLLAVVALMSTLVVFLDTRWEARNNSMDPDVPRPTSELRSGGPGSLVAWEDIGLKGRSVIGTGPTAADIERVTGAPAIEPVRIYVGLKSADTYDERAALAVEELRRVHAEHRAVLVVPGLTGTGWLEPQAIDSLEYLHGGDTAMVAAQYSISPSWVSSIFHPDQSRDGTRALFDAVHEWWSALPADHRPQLVVYGLSLGSQAIQEMFPDVDTLLEQVDGAVFAGTPSGTTLDESLRAGRDSGTPVYAPVLSARPSIRYFSDTAELADEMVGWEEPRVAFLEHPNDPVVWVDWSIFYRRPEWLTAGNRSPQLSSQMRYVPVVTGLQAVADLAMAESVPDDAGHKYGDATLMAWVHVTGDNGLDPQALASIREVIAQYDTSAPISQ
jgi:uncharacterized membrane protein